MGEVEEPSEARRRWRCGAIPWLYQRHRSVCGGILRLRAPAARKHSAQNDSGAASS